MSKPTYLSAVQELETAGYLVKDGDNHYQFYEMLPEEEEITITVNKADDGEFSF
jgi:hypothetical protein